MSHPSPAETADRDSDRRTAIYVYGLVPADVEPEPDATGVGDPPCTVSIVRHDEIAALVSEIPLDHPLGTPDDLTAHAQLLDGSAAVAPVVPLRFGTVLSDPESLVSELLAPHHDELLSALRELEGRAQFVVKGRYVEQAMLREVLDENPDAERMRAELRGKPEDATRDVRAALGELIYRGVEAKRVADTRRVLAALEELAPLVNERPPTDELDAAHLAVLVALTEQSRLEQTLAELGKEWDGRVELRLLGPMAPYDFVTKPQREE